MNLGQFPRRKYTAYETPIEYMPNLSRALLQPEDSTGDDSGGDSDDEKNNGNNNNNNMVHLWIKRDDMLGLAGGGNKTRKLEFVMADAIQQNNNTTNNLTIITSGAVQSNHCRLTLAACNKEGIANRCILVLEERVPGSYQEDASGNNYLFHLLGAERIVHVGLGEAPSMVERIADELRTTKEETEGRRRRRRRNVYIIPGGASNEIGATGYCACAAEIQHQQFVDQLPQFHSLVTASGSGGTHAGLLAGLTALRSPMKVVGISTRHDAATQKKHILDLSRKVYQHVVGSSSSSSNSDELLPSEDAVIVHDAYVGAGYSLPTVGMQEAVSLFARTEGILLDPVYSGKAAAGLLDLVRTGTYFPPGSHVLFLHTGGAPSLYHYQPLYNKNNKEQEPEK